MATIVTTKERRTLEIDSLGTSRWDALASAAIEWMRARDAAPRDAVVLIPFLQLLPLARRAFARAGGWQPRIETTRTLAATLGPATRALPGQLSFDPTLDALSAAALLRAQPWGAAWARRDSRGFDHATLALTRTAQALAQAAFAKPPDAREAYWSAARGALTPLAGPGATERLLARVALEWACLAPAPSTDRLFTMKPPSAWIAVQAGGADPLADTLLDTTATLALVIDTDAPEDDPFRAMTHRGERATPQIAVCDDFEHEAQAAAAQVIEHLRHGEQPVALIAQDRVLVRRVRALLERNDVGMLDETGWKLSTTRAAARVMALLRAARPDAGTDALFDWLKTGTAWTTRADQERALAELEAVCRRAQIARIAALVRFDLTPAPSRLLAAATEVLNGFVEVRRQPLGAWLIALAQALSRCGALSALQSDEAGRQLLIALHLTANPDAQTAEAWAHGASQIVMNMDDFRAWIDATLEQASFKPPAPAEGAVQVVITPLARAMLRPFAAIVFPGADDRRLGATVAPEGLLGDALAGELGLPTIAQQRSEELRAFAQIVDAPRLTLMRRRVDDGEPLGESPFVERLSLALEAGAAALASWVDPRIYVALAATPIRMSAPSASGLLPDRLSQNACEALRACPYRFFALSMLRLREDDELEREVEKRDYGSWLHAVLFDFHSTRAEPGGTAPVASAADEIARLMQIADRHRVGENIAEADFLPFGASFAVFAPRYITWLHARDAQGARWRAGEFELSVAPPALAGTRMFGRIDRIDDVSRDRVAALQLIDYKTGGAGGLRDKVKQPFEDTQLAFYAALMLEQNEVPLAGPLSMPLVASYLAVDGTQGIVEVEHLDVGRSAAALVDGLGGELDRLRDGAGLPALGVGTTCEYCAARGICRRDHWTDDAVAPLSDSPT